MKPVVRSIALPTGVRLPYAEQGDPAGLAVILLHGITDSWRSYETVLPHLPDSVHAFALTQRGHGDADRPATGYRTHDFAADLSAFADALGLERSVVVGHSLGSTVAARFAAERPERVQGLMMVAAFSTYRDNQAVVDFWESAVAPLCDPVDPAFVRDFQESTLAKPVPPEFLDMVVRESLKLPARVWHEAFASLLDDDFATVLDRIRAPTLLVWGDRDTFAQRVHQDELLAAIPGARLTVYSGAGHALHWEEPERFAREVAAFASSL